MSESKNAYTSHHFVQKALLKQFAKDGKLNFINFIDNSIINNYADKLLCQDNLYTDSNQNSSLEHDFDIKIESKIGQILKKLNNATDTITLENLECDRLKKYLLAQVYRTPHNFKSYQNAPTMFDFDTDRKINESPHDYWLREMSVLLNTKLQDLKTCKMESVRYHSKNVVDGSIMFVKTEDFFCINDLGYFIEQPPVDVNLVSKIFSKYINNNSNYKELLKSSLIYIKNYGSIDNYYFMPLTSKIGALFIHPLWCMSYYDSNLKDILKEAGLYSKCLRDYFCLPKKNVFNIIQINSNMTLFFNFCLINESDKGIVCSDDNKNYILNVLIQYDYFKKISTGFKKDVKSIIEKLKV